MEFIPNPCNKPQVDHIDNNRLNNKISNLRWVTNSENSMNKSLSKDNTSGVKGVFYFSQRNKYIAQIKHNYKYHHLGYFNTLEEAKEARQKKANELFGEFTNKIEKIKTELEELQELEKELEDLIK
jgi:D-Tyr-tRNAtyr deacylase